MKKIDLFLTPSDALNPDIITSREEFIQRVERLAGVSYPYVNVWNMCCHLGWMIFDGTDMTSKTELISNEHLEKLGITEEMLYSAIEEAGGAINWNSHYPINDEIREKREEALE